MMKLLKLFLLILSFYAGAQSFPEKPTNYITDETNSISIENQTSLNNKLRAYEDSTTNQIFVFVANSLNGKNLEQYSQDIFHKWKIGQNDRNNGVLIAIFVTDHKFRIQTGYGLEGVLPDLLTKRIQDNDMRPSFKKNNYYEGIDKGVDQLIYYSKYEFNTIESEESTWEVFLFFYVFASIFLLITLLIAKGIKNKPTAKKAVITISIILFIIPFIGACLLIFMLLIALSMRKDWSRSSGSSNWSSSSDSSWSNSDSSSSWSSSDSSSSFDGGGGGDSGGGGSSSDW